MNKREHESDTNPTSGGRANITRRSFLKGSGAAAAATGMTAAAAATAFAQDGTPSPMASPAAMDHMGDQRAAAFFTIHEAATVEALTARILPGDADDPGAREAGVVLYIDRALSGTNFGLDLKTYTQGPFPVTEESETAVEASSSPDVYRAVLVGQDNISRYGFQSVMGPQEMYRRGLEFVDAHSQAAHGADFIDLDEAQQDEVLTEMESDEAEEFAGPSGSAFFMLLRNDTIKGMFSDPMYGGNLDMAGWRLIGYPGAQRLYSGEDLKNTSFSREPQSLAQLMAAEGH